MIKCEPGEIALSTSEKAKPKSVITHVIVSGEEERFILLMKVKGRG